MKTFNHSRDGIDELLTMVHLINPRPIGEGIVMFPCANGRENQFSVVGVVSKVIYASVTLDEQNQLVLKMP